MRSPIRILYLEDNASDLALITATLEAECLECEVLHVKSREEFEAALERGHFDVILADYALPNYDGFAALRAAQQRREFVPFILLSGTLDEEHAVQSLKNGAADYILKQRLTRLVPAIRRALTEAEERMKRALAESARRKAEEQIREQAALLEKAQDAICVTDLDDTILYWNRSAERLYGWPREETLLKNADTLLFRDGCLSRHEALVKVKENGEWKGELEQVTRDGRKLIVESRWTLLRDEEGEPKRVLIINTDVTEKRMIETQLLRTQRMESIGALAGGIAHDLNNMLSPILMAVDLIEEAQTDNDSRLMLKMVRTSAQRGADMVKQILSFARGTSGTHAELNIRTVLQEVVRLIRETFPRSIRIESTAGPEHRVVGNATQLHQVLLNLCVNARDAMPDGGTLSIAADNVVLDRVTTRWQVEPVSGPYVRLSVCDSGHGIAPEIIDQIFQPFFTTKQITKGTGLGLSTVSGIVKQHRGFVDLHSEVGAGTTFHVFLPAVVQPHAMVAALGPEAPAFGAGEQILVVDDEIALLEMTRLTLEAFNYHVLTAAEGSEAIKLYQQHRRDIRLVITDLMMPNMDGASTVLALRRIDPGVRTLCVSGFASASEWRTLPENTPFLNKPFTTTQLLRTVREVMLRPVAC